MIFVVVLQKGANLPSLVANESSSSSRFFDASPKSSSDSFSRLVSQATTVVDNCQQSTKYSNIKQLPTDFKAVRCRLGAC